MIQTAVKFKLRENGKDGIRSQLRDFLKLSGWDVTVHYQGPLSAKGFPDMTALRDGVTVYIEVKTEDGVQSRWQKDYQRRIEEHGGKYVLARQLEDLIHLCPDTLKVFL